MSDLFGEICAGISLILAWIMIIILRFEVNALRKRIETFERE